MCFCSFSDLNYSNNKRLEKNNYISGWLYFKWWGSIPFSFQWGWLVSWGWSIQFYFSFALLYCFTFLFWKIHIKIWVTDNFYFNLSTVRTFYTQSNQQSRQNSLFAISSFKLEKGLIFFSCKDDLTQIDLQINHKHSNSYCSPLIIVFIYHLIKSMCYSFGKIKE